MKALKQTELNQVSGGVSTSWYQLDPKTGNITEVGCFGKHTYTPDSECYEYCYNAYQVQQLERQ